MACVSAALAKRYTSLNTAPTSDPIRAHLGQNSAIFDCFTVRWARIGLIEPWPLANSGYGGLPLIGQPPMK